MSSALFTTGFTPVSPDAPRPEWLKIRVASCTSVDATNERIHGKGLHTVCESAACPNIGHCWRCGHATIMILGNQCTRHCRFCNVSKGLIFPPDKDEPARVAESVKESGIKEIVITSVTRDDLPDGGAAHWAATIQAIRKAVPDSVIEVLVPDFKGSLQALQTVFDSKPDVFGHNIETVPRLYAEVRPEANYQRSLDVLRESVKAGFITKTSMMLGLGETDDEIYCTMKDIRSTGTDILFLGQYLRPTKEHIPVAGFLSPEHFAALGKAAMELGFGCVASAPLVRSSYHEDSQTAFVEKRSTLKAQKSK